MIKIENVEIMGWEAAIRGMRNPMNSWENSDSAREWPDCGACPDEWRPFHIGPNDLDLMKKLRNAGTDHRKFMRMITVYVDVTAPLYWWKEFDTYKVGTVANSCSTMHKIADKEFELDDFSCEHLLQSSPTQLELYSALACAPTCDGKPQWTPMMHLLSTIAGLNQPLCAGDISKVLERLPADAKVIFVDDVVGVINIRGGEKECFLQK